MENPANDVVFLIDKEDSDKMLKAGIAIVAAVVTKLIWMAAESLLDR